MNRGTKSLTSSETLRVKVTRGNAVLVQLKGTGFTGTVDFQSSPDNVNWSNHPYVDQRSAAPTRSVDQLSNPTGPTVYLITPPVRDTRIVVSVSAGTLDVVWREVLVEN